MKVSEAFPSKWIAAADLENKNIRLTIARIEMETVGDDIKPVLYFKQAKKGLVLNKVNAKEAAQAYGDEMEDWPGNELILFPVMTTYQGKTVEAVRVRPPQPKDNPKPKIETAPQRMAQQPMPDEDIGDPIPF